uniref:(northern house mosquito) hypothetical protein n=1 Tax=Culex pipiens TaxID=7175 RepID=A0A8D8B2B6_CULPI
MMTAVTRTTLLVFGRRCDVSGVAGCRCASATYTVARVAGIRSSGLVFVVSVAGRHRNSCRTATAVGDDVASSGGESVVRWAGYLAAWRAASRLVGCVGRPPWKNHACGAGTLGVDGSR